WLPVPAGLVLVAEEQLHSFGAVGAGGAQDLQTFRQPGQARVTGDGGVAVGAFDAVERGGEVEDLAAQFEEVAIENVAGSLGSWHGGSPGVGFSLSAAER